MDSPNSELRQLLQTLAEVLQHIPGADALPDDGSAPHDRDSKPQAAGDHQRLRQLLKQLEQYQELLIVDTGSGSQPPSDGVENAKAATREPPVSGWRDDLDGVETRDSRRPRTLGDFRISRLIASGGMGTVYEAEQISLHRRVALKVLPFAALIEPHRLQRFKNEAQAAASLRHPNIVRVHSVGCDRGVHYFAMDYIEGRTLAELIQDLRMTSFWPDDQVPHPKTVSTKLACPDNARVGESVQAADNRPDRLSTDLSETGTPPADSLPDLSEDDFELAVGTISQAARTSAYFRRVAEWGVQACEALAHAHEMGVVHRDITPSNLIIDTSQNLWITDFGLAMTRGQSHLTAPGDLLGTLRYMSPEQAGKKGHPVDFHTDIYSFGATLYELLTLQPPFDSDNRHSLQLQIIAGKVRPISRLNNAVPWDLETIILTAMTTEPENRYHSAREMADDLNRFLHREPIHAKRPAFPQRCVKWVRRNAQFVTVGVTALLLLIIVMTISVIVIGRARTEAVKQREIAIAKQRLSEQHQERLRRHLYVADMTLCLETWKIADLRCAIERLATYEPQPGTEDLRDFSWHYLWTLCHQELRLLDGHAGDVYCATFAHDRSIIATACRDGFVRMWSVATGQLTATLASGQSEVNSVAFSHDNRLLAAACDGGVVVIWDLDADKRRHEVACSDKDVFTVAFSPDDSQLACGGCDHYVHLLETNTWQETSRLVGHTGNVESLAFSPTGYLIATGGDDRTIRLWEPTLGRLKEKWTAHDKRVGVVCFSHDGKRLAAGSGRGMIQIWDVDNPKKVLSFDAHATWVHGLAFAPGDHVLASGGKDGFIRLWNTRTGNEENVIRGHVGRVWGVEFSSDGRYLLSAGADRTARLWNPYSPQECQSGPFIDHAIFQQIVLPNHQVAAVADSVSGATIWTPSQPGLNRVIGSCGVPTECIAATPDRQAMVLGYHDGTSAVWNPMTGEKIRDLGTHNSPCRAIAISSDGKWIATGDEQNGIVILWDVATGKQVHRLAVKQWIFALAFTGNGKRLSIGTTAGQIFHLSTQSGKVDSILNAHSGSIVGLVYSPDGRILASCSRDRTVKLWDTATGHLRASLVGHRGDVRSIAFSPDGKTLASGSNDGTVRLWHVATARHLLTFVPTEGRVQSVSFSPDGTMLVAATSGRNNVGRTCIWYANRDFLLAQISPGNGDPDAN